MNLPILSPSQFVALVNQTLEFAYPIVEVEGEVSNYKVSKGRWVYFDINDDFSKVRCFGTVYMLPGPVEDGMVVKVVATPKLHNQFGFSLNIQSLKFSGEGTIKKAADLLAEKLKKEGLFAEDRKRQIPYPPTKIALVASAESAAYKDFIKVLSARYGGIIIEHINVAVQGDSAITQVTRAIEVFNRQSELADVLVVIRGGGSSDDLQAFSSEQVTRAVAASRIPTVVAIGHEVDISLAELAADLRASTPSNAAELIAPDRKNLLKNLQKTSLEFRDIALSTLESKLDDLVEYRKRLNDGLIKNTEEVEKKLNQNKRTLDALSPQATLSRGFAIVRSDSGLVTTAKQTTKGEILRIELAKDTLEAEVQ